MNLRVHFYGPRGDGEGVPKPVSLWVKVQDPTFIHCTLEVDQSILFDQPYGFPAGWYESSSHLRTRPPAASLSLNVSASPWDLERSASSVEGWRTDRVGSVGRVLFGYPEWPRNCTTSVCTILTGLGFPVAAVTPDQLWSEMRGRSTVSPYVLYVAQGLSL